MSKLEPDAEQMQRVAIFVEALQNATEKLGYRTISRQTLELVVKSYMKKYNPLDKPSDSFAGYSAATEVATSQVDSTNVVKINFRSNKK